MVGVYQNRLEEVISVIKNLTGMETMVVVNGMTAHRANVIFARTGSTAIGIMKAQMIDLLKEKLKNGVAHFVYMKKDGTLREAWGTTSSNLMKANINGRGISRDSVNCVCYWDCEKGGFRSLRFENLLQVF
jgi:hypothetical protein